MALTLNQLITPASTEEIKAKIYEILGYLGVNVTAWQSGGVLRLLIAVLSAIMALFLRLVALANRSNFLDLAAGSWLILRAKQNYGVDYIGPTRATTTVTLDNAGGGIFTYEPGEFIVQDADNPTTLYQNPETFTLGALQTGLEVDVEALEEGSASSVAANKLTVLVTTIPNVTCTNETAAFGLDGQTAEELRQLCRDSLGRLSPFGPEAAYVYFAKIAKRLDGSPIGVTRVWVSPYGIPVRVYVAGASGAIAGTVGDTATDLGKVDYDVQNNAVPNPVTCTLASATNVGVTISCTVAVDRAANLTTPEVQLIARTGAYDYIKSVSIGGVVISPAAGKLYVKSLEQAIKAASPYFAKVDVSLPAADVSLAEGEVAVISGTPTVAVAQVTV